jgi:MazG family protein
VVIVFNEGGIVSGAFDKLVALMARLRGPEGCPWDREQTLQSLRTYLLEETYETLEAIDRGDTAALQEELGDLLLEIVFLCQVCSEKDLFTIEDAARGIYEKLVRRHPHVFGEEKASGPREALGRWETIKNEERRSQGNKGGVLDGVPPALPALLRAHRISEKAAMVGFDWEEPALVLDKIEEEIRELREAMANRDGRATEEELGDLLFAAANLGRLSGTDAEMALQAANRKFTERFRRVERELDRRGLSPSAEIREEMERLWESVKNQSTGST